MIQVDKVHLFQVRKELVVPFQASSHSARDLNHILIRVEGGGHVGWGECSAPNDPYYLGETFETSWHLLAEFLVPAVVGKSFESVEAFVTAYGQVKGNTFAKAGLEMAAWDYFGRATGRSLATMLGGTAKAIPSGVSLGMEKTSERLLELIERHLDQGYRRVKIKVSPGHDLAVLEAVRARFPKIPLMVDANSAYTLGDAAHLSMFDPFDLTMIEQPLAWDDMFDHAELQKRVRTAICLDESIRNADHGRRAIEIGACRVVNVKVGRVGGLLEAKRLHDVCARRSVPVWCGGMHDYGIGRAANVALASLPGFTLPGDISGSDKYFVQDIIDPPFIARDGMVTVPSEPGLGVQVVESRVRENTVRERAFGSAEHRS